MRKIRKQDLDGIVDKLDDVLEYFKEVSGTGNGAIYGNVEKSYKTAREYVVKLIDEVKKCPWVED